MVPIQYNEYYSKSESHTGISTNLSTFLMLCLQPIYHYLFFFQQTADLLTKFSPVGTGNTGLSGQSLKILMTINNVCFSYIFLKNKTWCLKQYKQAG